MVHTIARYRSSPPAHAPRLEALPLFLAGAHAAAFWTQLMPLHLDVSLKDVVAERWVLAYEPAPAASTSTAAASTTELILLSQSLYSHIRLLPIHASPNMALRIATADGRLLSSSAPNGHLPRSFSPSAKLRAYRFKSASTPHGFLHLSVVYDAAISLSVDLFSSGSSSTTPLSTSGASHGRGGGGVDPIHTKPSHGSNEMGYRTAIPIVRLDENGLEILEELQPSSPQSYTQASEQYPRHYDDTSSSDEEEEELNEDLPQKHNAPDNLRRESFESLSGKFKSLSMTQQQQYHQHQQHSNSNLTVNTSSSPSRKALTNRIGSNSSTSAAFSTTPPVRSLFHQHLSASYTQHLTPTNGQLPRSNPIFTTASPSFSNLPAADLLSGSLIGSYEESILNGRMSSLPSKPLPFIADLGVVALGKCKNPALKCPKGLRFCFDACFYEFGGCGGGSGSLKGELAHGRAAGRDEFEGVSPYVGNVDVEGLNGMIWTGADDLETDVEGDNDTTEEGFRKKWIGGWRVPPKGQLQIIIKNSAGTAVKVFLIPYDFRDMPPNTKTFLRQKIFVVKPPPSTNVNTAAILPHQQGRRNSLSTPTGPPKDRLRDAIHVHFQCTSRKRIYLTRQVRVVFGHKGLESDEKCRVVLEGPSDPKYIDLPVTAPAVNVPWTPNNDAKTKPREEILSVSPSRRSFSAGNGFSYFNPNVENSGGDYGSNIGSGTIPIRTPNTVPTASSSSTGTSIPRRSSLGVSMMNFAGVSLDHPHHILPQPSPQQQQQQQQQRILSTSRSIDNFRRPSSLHHHSTVPDDEDSEGEDLFRPQPLISSIGAGVGAGVPTIQKSGNFWMAPPSNKSSLSMALSMSSGSVSSSCATSGANTPKHGGARSRHVSSSVEGGGVNNNNLNSGDRSGAGGGSIGSMLKLEVLDEVRMMEVGPVDVSVSAGADSVGVAHNKTATAMNEGLHASGLNTANSAWSSGFR
ncbi:hypothetical protein BDR26DRAFT_856992 [Obelidium mucronatum]|nr:hypothetical protein BDR26DRAFT_856992 [Obelidium mucronatum]